MGRTPLLLPLVGLVGGILLSTLFPAAPFGICILIGLIGVSGAFWRADTFFFLLIFVSIGWGADLLNRPNGLPVSGLNVYSAKVLNARETTGKAMMGIISIDSVNGFSITPFNVSAQIIGHRNEICQGERISFHSVLEPLPEQEKIEDVTFVNPLERRMRVIGFVRILPDSLQFCGDAEGFIPAMQRLNRHLAVRLSESKLDDNAFALLSAMLLADKSSLLPEEVDIFSAAGLSHVLALSGTHVAVIVSLISLALFPLYVARRNVLRYLISILILWFYALLTGLSPSVTRAVVMATVYLFGRILQRESVPLNSLCLAAIILLIINPLELFDAGFQMSFAAVAGIIIFYPLLNLVNRRNHPWIYFLWSYPALSISAMLLTSLVSARYFHTFPLYFLFANLVIVPIMPLILFGGILLIAFPGADMIARIVNWTCGFMESIARFTAELPHAVIADVYQPLWLTLLLLIMFVVIGVGLHKKKNVVVIASVMIAAFGIAANFISPQTFPEHESFQLDKAIVERCGKELTVHVYFRNDSECEALRVYYERRLRHYSARRHLNPLRVEFLPK